MRVLLLLFCFVSVMNSRVLNPERGKVVDENEDEVSQDVMERFMERSMLSEQEVDMLEDDFEPMLIPKLTREEKRELILASGQEPRRHRVRKHRGRKQRDLRLKPWRQNQVQQKKTGVPRPTNYPIALSIDTCPAKFDAVTHGYNGRTYVFAGEKVYQVWYENNLPQKASYEIGELFSGGPRKVTAAMTNSRSGVTVLFSGRTSYRFRWSRKAKRFHLAKNRTPAELPRNITITPTLAFEWFDGNQECPKSAKIDPDNGTWPNCLPENNSVIAAKHHFYTYDAFWNLPTFNGETKRYFPNLPRDLIGMSYSGGDTILMYTASNKVKVYNTKKYRVVQEYPIKIGEYVGCL